jgi:hypothetical protein
MREIFGRSEYDTEKANLIAERELTDNRGYGTLSEYLERGRRSCLNRIYRTKSENWFLHIIYEIGDEEIEPLDPPSAYVWLCENVDEEFADRHLRARWWHSARQRKNRITGA